MRINDYVIISHKGLALYLESEGLPLDLGNVKATEVLRGGKEQFDIFWSGLEERHAFSDEDSVIEVSVYED